MTERTKNLVELREFATHAIQREFEWPSAKIVEIFGGIQEVIFSDRVINFFLEKEQNLHKALNIFIRINSGGKPLDFSDLIMSIAIANWEKKDARQEIHKLVDAVQEIGFSISKDLSASVTSVVSIIASRNCPAVRLQIIFEPLDKPPRFAVGL